MSHSHCSCFKVQIKPVNVSPHHQLTKYPQTPRVQRSKLQGYCRHGLGERSYKRGMDETFIMVCIPISIDSSCSAARLITLVGLAGVAVNALRIRRGFTGKVFSFGEFIWDSQCFDTIPLSSREISCVVTPTASFFLPLGRLK